MKSHAPVIVLLILLLPKASASSNDQTKLLDSLEKIMKKHQIPGMMLTLVNKDTTLYSGGLGYADVAKQEKVTSAHVFRLGSVTKTFTALAILRLIKDKKLTLEDTILKIAPELPIANRWESTHPVKVIHLLEHTAGFDDMHFNAVYRKDTLPIMHWIAVNQLSKSLTCRWRPGLMSSYSNPGYVILGYLIEKLSGETYEQFVENHVLKPLDMKNAHFSIPYKFSTMHSKGYLIQPKGGAKEANFYQIYGNAAGGLCASSDDMSKFLKFMLNNGKVGDNSLYDSLDLSLMQYAQSTLSFKSGFKSGYGKAMYRSMYSANRSYFGHSGGIDGFISFYGFQPEIGRGYAFSINSMSSVREISKLLAEYLSREAAKLTFIPTPIPSYKRAWFESYLGYYSVANSRNELFKITDYLFNGVNVWFEGDTLMVRKLFDNTDSYLHAGNGAFVLKGQSLPSLYLLEDDDGNKWIEGEAFYTPNNLLLARFWLIILATGFIMGMILAPFGLVWCIMLATKGINWKEFQIRISPVVALASFMGLLFTFSVVSGDSIVASEFNTITLSIFLLSVSFFVFGNYGLYMQIRHIKRSVHWGIHLLTFPSSLAYMLFSWFMLYHGLIGIMVWLY